MWGRKTKSMVEAGDRAPSFRLKSLRGGETRSLDEMLARGPALVTFFKISCPVCQLTLPFLERLAASASMQVVGISQDDEKSTEAFNQRFGVTFPTLLDASKDGYPASNAYGISSVPSVFLVNKDGSVEKSFSGFSKSDLEMLGRKAGVETFQPGENVPEFKAG